MIDNINQLICKLKSTEFFDSRYVNQLPHYVNLIGVGGGGSYFDSLYESFQALTSVQVSHFVEWFSGSGLSAIWTQYNGAGSGTFATADEIDGGFGITTGSNVNDTSGIYFNSKRHYDYQNCEMVTVFKRTSATCAIDVGFSNTAPNAAGTNSVSARDYSANTYKALISVDGSPSSSTTESSVPVDTNWNCYKITVTSSDLKMYIDGVLEVTKSTNRPAAILQPFTNVYNVSTGSGRTGQFRYLEAYNTSVSISSSLYERLSALTQVMGQRVVETFVGSAIQSDRWNKTDKVGTGTLAMEDSIDGGFTLTTQAITNGESQINFNNKRQYDPADSVFLATVKRPDTDDLNDFGLSNITTGGATQLVLVRNFSGDTFVKLASADGSYTSTDTDIAVHTNWAFYKIDCSSADNKLYIDGVLKVTKTTNRPTSKAQPIFLVFSSAGSAVGVSVRYCECYNKLGTETDYPSVYEMFNPLTTVAKAHFWDWFDGNGLDTTRWTLSGTGAMSDSVDGGYQLTSSGSDYIYFNNISQYNYAGAILIAVVQRIAGAELDVGFRTTAASGEHRSQMVNDTGNTYITLQTRDNLTTSSSDSSVAVHTNETVVKIELGASNNKLYLDGVLEVTKSTNLPASKLQPYFLGYDASSHTTLIRYIEAKNV